MLTSQKHALTQSLIDDVFERVSAPSSALIEQTGYKELNIKTIITSAPIIKKKVVEKKDKGEHR